MNLAFLGYGALGKQLHNFILQSQKINSITIFDDEMLKQGNQQNVFAFNDFNQPQFKNHQFIIALGYHHLEKKVQLINELKKYGSTLFTFIHPTSFVNESARIGAGSFIYPMCNIDANVVIEEGVLLNNSVTISHDCVIGKGSYVSPGAILSGNVKIGSISFIGSGAVIANGVSIGTGVNIGIGSVITQNLHDHCSAIGNPLKVLDKPLKLR